jgi:hypothetical protein
LHFTVLGFGLSPLLSRALNIFILHMVLDGRERSIYARGVHIQLRIVEGVTSKGVCLQPKPKCCAKPVNMHVV